MGINKEYSCLEQNCIVYQKCIENDEDYQETLPGYCDDVFRIIKCTSKSYITSCSADFDEFKIFGRTEICVTYLNENSEMCYADFDEEFTKVVNIDGLTDKAFAKAVIVNKYTNIKVINQRKLSVHISNSIKLCVYDKSSISNIKSCDKSKLRKKTIKTASIIDSMFTKMDYDEEIEFQQDKNINRVISVSSYAVLNEVKIIKDKALVKGCVNCEVIYTDEDAKICKIKKTFDVSKILDSQGINDEDIAIANLYVGSLYFKLKTNKANNLSCIQLFGDVAATVTFIREKCTQVVTDGYIIKSKCNCEYKELLCKTNGKYINESASNKLQFKLNNDIKEIVEIDITGITTETKNNCINCCVSCNIMYKTTDDEIVSVVEEGTFNYDLGSFDDAISSISINSFDYSISSNDNVEIRLSTTLCAYAFCNETITILNDIHSTDDPIISHALTIYFAKKNENVWDIAKSFSSDSDLIIKENELATDVIDCNRTIIIPGV